MHFAIEIYIRHVNCVQQTNLDFFVLRFKFTVESGSALSPHYFWYLFNFVLLILINKIIVLLIFRETGTRNIHS